jgi:hypothetical protein
MSKRAPTEADIVSDTVRRVLGWSKEFWRGMQWAFELTGAVKRSNQRKGADTKRASTMDNLVRAYEKWLCDPKNAMREKPSIEELALLSGVSKSTIRKKTIPRIIEHAARLRGQ